MRGVDGGKCNCNGRGAVLGPEKSKKTSPGYKGKKNETERLDRVVKVVVLWREGIKTSWRNHGRGRSEK